MTAEITPSKMANYVYELSKKLCAKVKAGEFKLPLKKLNDPKNLIATHIIFTSYDFDHEEVKVKVYHSDEAHTKLEKTEVFLSLKALDNL